VEMLLGHQYVTTGPDNCPWEGMGVPLCLGWLLTAWPRSALKAEGCLSYPTSDTYHQAGVGERCRVSDGIQGGRLAGLAGLAGGRLQMERIS